MMDTHPIQTAIKAHLEAQPYFQGPPPIPVVARIHSDLERMLQEQNAGYESGILVIIHPPYGTNAEPHGNQVTISWTVSLDVFEWGVFAKSPVSGAQKTGFDVAMELAAPPTRLSNSGRNGLHGLRLSGFQPLFFSSINSIDAPTESGALVNFHQVQFTTRYLL